MTKFQKLKFVFCIIALIITVISCLVPFVWMTTAQADEIVTTSSYTSSTYSILCYSVISGSTLPSLIGSLGLTTFKFTLKQGGVGIEVTLGLNDNTVFCPVNAPTTGINGNFVSFPFEDTCGIYDTGTEELYYGLLPFVVNYPTNWSSRFSTSADLVPNYITFSIRDKVEGKYFYQFFQGNSVVSLPSDAYYSEFVVTIGLKQGDDDAVIDILFPCYLDSSSITYLFESGELFTVIPVDSNTYDNGYNKGFNDGINTESSRVNTTSASYLAGKNKGYSEGVNDSGQYTFFSLISSVVDVPIKAFVGLLDFNLFGIDMSSFYLSLFTLCIIIAIVKMLL